MIAPYLLLLAGIAIGLSLLMMLAWWVAERTGQSGWIDATWSFAIGVGGVTAALFPFPDIATPTTRQWIVAGLVALWSLRLAVHIAGRTHGAGDDPRYAQLRREWGADARARLFWFLQIQALAGVPLVLAVLVAARRPDEALDAGDWAGIVLLVGALIGEAVADWQLSRFRSDPAHRGLVCDVGLWGVSRHPNYFFEWLGWVAYVPIALGVTADFAAGWLALGAPVLMYWLLVHVSGIPLLEAHMLRSRGDKFRTYQARVNAFWPGPLRSVTPSI